MTTIVEPTITRFEHKLVNRGVVISDVQPASVATLTFPDGDFVSVSRYDNEPAWVVDSHFKPNGYAVFSNGTGSRCTRPRGLKTDAPIVIALDEKRELAMNAVSV